MIQQPRWRYWSWHSCLHDNLEGFMAATFDDPVLKKHPTLPPRRHYLRKIVTVCVVVGGIYGATLGSVLATTADAIIPIEIVAAVLAIIGGVLGSRIVLFVGFVNQFRFARPFLATVGAVVSAFAGVLPIILVLAFPWSALGAIAGWFVGRYNARSWPRIMTEILGAVLGGCLGTIICSMEQNEVATRVGVLWGMGIGAGVGLLLPLIFVKALDSFADQWIRMTAEENRGKTPEQMGMTLRRILSWYCLHCH